MKLSLKNSSYMDANFYNFINEDVLPLAGVSRADFWRELEVLVDRFSPDNQQLLLQRDALQAQIDEWHKSHQGELFDAALYTAFLTEIGYLEPEADDFQVTTENVDAEIAQLAGPQLVVPLKNARFALNAANARWGSLYDALYGTDVIPYEAGLKPGKRYNPARGQQVIQAGRDFLDEIFPLETGSHHNVSSYVVYYQHLLAFFADGGETGLQDPGQFVALNGHKENPESILLKNNGLHVELVFDRHGEVGKNDLANLQDIQIEAALTTIMDCEDSVAAVDAEDKLEVYRNWLGLVRGDLTAVFDKGGVAHTRRMNCDRVYTAGDGEEYRLPGRSLMLVRNVGLAMNCDIMQTSQGEFVPEGIIDAVVTGLIGAIDIRDSGRKKRNSRTGSVYIVKPKLHGSREVAFTCALFSAVEALVGLTPNTLKIGIMDEERRTTLNLKACIREARERVVFINTGFLDRTGDEIHTSMHAGAFMPKAWLKEQPWITAYENNNVDVGLACGLPGHGQIGKGMWPMPDEMEKMMASKIAHPRAGANTAWVPSPTAAVLHALHYHRVDVAEVQDGLRERAQAARAEILQIPLLSAEDSLSAADIERELENNIQGILGYVVRWVELGIGCSKVPDINDIGLMEDRATLRISSQHIANWLLHGLCTRQQLDTLLLRMAAVVDAQNAATDGYQPMATDPATNLAFQAARDLIVLGAEQPNGYTEHLLQKYRLQQKQRA